MGWEGASMSIPREGRVLQKPVTVRYSCCDRVSALAMSALSLSCQILLMFKAHRPMKAFLSNTCYAGVGEKVGGGGGDVALNSLLRTCLSLKQSVFLMDFECFFANQEPRRESP